jgi:F0F1-type ATP synthase delta subunit
MIGSKFSVQNAKDVLCANMEKENQSVQIVMEVMYVLTRNRRINVLPALPPADVNIVI